MLVPRVGARFERTVIRDGPWVRSNQISEAVDRTKPTKNLRAGRGRSNGKEKGPSRERAPFFVPRGLLARCAPPCVVALNLGYASGTWAVVRKSVTSRPTSLRFAGRFLVCTPPAHADP